MSPHPLDQLSPVEIEGYGTKFVFFRVTVPGEEPRYFIRGGHYLHRVIRDGFQNDVAELDRTAKTESLGGAMILISPEKGAIRVWGSSDNLGRLKEHRVAVSMIEAKYPNLRMNSMDLEV